MRLKGGMNKTVALIAKERKWRQLSRTVHGEPPSFEASLLACFSYDTLQFSYFNIKFHWITLLDKFLEIRTRLICLYLAFFITSQLPFGPSPSLAGLSQWLLEELPASHLLSITSCLQCNRIQPWNTPSSARLIPRYHPNVFADSEGLAKSCPSQILCQSCFPPLLLFPWPSIPAAL